MVDLVQVFHDQAAVDEAIADGQSRNDAQYLSTYVRNENPRLRTLTLAGNVRVELLGGDAKRPSSTSSACWPPTPAPAPTATTTC